MTTRNTVIRSMHDVGLAVWCGGALMGAIGLNGAANQVKDQTQRGPIASAGWARWAPVNAAAIPLVNDGRTHDVQIVLGDPPPRARGVQRTTAAGSKRG